MPVTLNRELAVEKLNEVRRKARFWRPDNGANRIRVLPGWNGATVPFVEFRQHFVRNLDGEEKGKFFPCPKMAGKFCPLCGYVVELKKCGVEAAEEVANGLRAGRTFLYNVVVRSKEAEGIQVYSAPFGIHETILTYYTDPEWPMFLDLHRGLDVVVNKTGNGLATKYSLTLSPNPSLASRTSKDVVGWWEENAPDLSRFTREVPSEAELVAVVDNLSGRNPGTVSEADLEHRVTRPPRPTTAPEPDGPPHPRLALAPEGDSFAVEGPAEDSTEEEASVPETVSVPIPARGHGVPTVVVPVEVTVAESRATSPVAKGTTDKFAALKEKLAADRARLAGKA